MKKRNLLMSLGASILVFAMFAVLPLSAMAQSVIEPGVRVFSLVDNPADSDCIMYGWRGTVICDDGDGWWLVEWDGIDCGHDGNGGCGVTDNATGWYVEEADIAGLIIDKCKVKAGKKGKGDKIKFSGWLTATEDDFIAEMGGNVVVTIDADEIFDNETTTFRFPIEEDNLKKGKYKSTKVKPADKGDPVTSIKIDTKKGKMKFSGKDVDLDGLGCPITVTIQIGDYIAVAILNEDIVNGPKKPCPLELMPIM